MAEIGLRLAGFLDFPLYETNNEIGYIPKASQSGSFLRSHDWQFNSLHMGAPEFRPTPALDTLLVGDSVVLGGNPYRQEERLGPRLQQITGGSVWPISAGSWALRNELIYLKKHLDVVKAVDRIIFVLNSEDFAEASSWACEITHPRTYPSFAMSYVFRKYIYNWSPCGDPPEELKVPPGNWVLELKEFLQEDGVIGKPIAFFLYPNRQEASNAEIRVAKLEQYASSIRQLGVNHVYSIGRDSRWRSDFYKDGIHPTKQGTVVLADIINLPEPIDDLN